MTKIMTTIMLAQNLSEIDTVKVERVMVDVLRLRMILVGLSRLNKTIGAQGLSMKMYHMFTMNKVKVVAIIIQMAMMITAVMNIMTMIMIGMIRWRRIILAIMELNLIYVIRIMITVGLICHVTVRHLMAATAPMLVVSLDCCYGQSWCNCFCPWTCRG